MIRLRSLVAAVVALAALAPGVHAQTWADFATVSMTDPTHPKLTANRLCYSDGTDLACDGAAGLLTTSGTLQIANVSATGNVSANKFIGDGSSLTGVSTNLSETIAINDLSDASASTAFGSLYMGNGSGAASASNFGNTAVGIGTLAANTTGGNNTTLGYRAMYNGTGGGFNVAVGIQSLYNDSASNNTALGSYALYSDVTGLSNVAVGYSALTNSTDSYNAAVGALALYKNTTGMKNAALGFSAGYGGNSSIINNSSLLGSYAGQALTSATDNTFVGYNAGGGVTTGSSNTVIGSMVSPYSNTGNFQLAIANAIWGNVGSATGNRNLIGINVSSPTANLEVSGTISATSLIVNGQPYNAGSSGDRIVSGSLLAVANSATGYISLSTAGTTWGYFNSGLSYLPTISATTMGVSYTVNYFGQNVANVSGGGGNWIVSGSASVSTSIANGGTIQLANTSGVVMTVSGSYVGVGTSNPAFTMQISGTDSYSMDGGGTGGLALSDATTPAKKLYMGYDKTLGTNGSGYLQAVYTGTAYTPLLLQPNGGYVGIGGSNAPASALQVTDNTVGSQIGGKGFILRNNSSGDYLNIWNYASHLFAIEAADASTYRNVVLQPHGGLVGIGTGAITPGATLEVNGTLMVDNLPSYATGPYVCSSGGLLNTGSSCSASDIRLKKNIVTLTGGLDLITKLRPVHFDWKDESRGTKRQIGLIAQEVEKVFPEVVDTNSQGYRNLQYDKLVAPLIAAVKELKADNDDLRAQLDAVQRRLDQVEARRP